MPGAEGRPRDHGAYRPGGVPGRGPAPGQRLRRSRAGAVLGGVAAGIAEFTGGAPGTIRALWSVSVPLSGGITLLGYLLLWLLLPAGDSGGGRRR